MGFTRALIMAGGKSERMRAGRGGPHKALARVGGLTLLEWNARQLVRHGFRDIVVAVSSKEPELSDFVRASVAPVAARAGAKVALYEEKTPLGSVGAAREVVGDADGVLLSYVDNLASIDPQRLVDFHERSRFAATVATHVEPFQMPFGRLWLTDNQVTTYAEKPVVHVQVSSGTCVLSKKACVLIPEGKRTGVGELFAILSERGEAVGAFRHDERWIEIHDAAALDRARVLFQGD
ncbi:MAG: NTP transferase domain-containing protein [Candidatus Cybelea sp.]